MFRKLILSAMMFIVSGGFAMADEWDKTFPKNDKVEVVKVRFKNKYGIMLVGDLYIPKNTSTKLPAIALAGPYSAVKEQVSGRYAQEMSSRGFITLAFDPSYTGESGGEPRNIASSDINTEDFSAAIDFLANHENVDSDKIGIIGICGFGGFGLNAAAIDTRIKATATITMYDMTRFFARGYNDILDKKARHELKQRLNNQRTLDFKNGTFAQTTINREVSDDIPQFVKEYIAYYKTKGRGFHPRSIGSNGSWNLTNALSLINMPILIYSDEIESAVLMVHGENAHSRYLSEDAFKKLQGSNKELYIVKGANHTDLYDNLDKIPFDKIEGFFVSNLHKTK